MIVHTNNCTYIPIPEDGSLVFDQLSLTLYRASMFHKAPYTNWFIQISKEELKELEGDPRIKDTVGAFDVMNRVFKGIVLRVDGEEHD